MFFLFFFAYFFPFPLLPKQKHVLLCSSHPHGEAAGNGGLGKQAKRVINKYRNRYINK